MLAQAILRGSVKSAAIGKNQCLIALRRSSTTSLPGNVPPKSLARRIGRAVTGVGLGLAIVGVTTGGVCFLDDAAKVKQQQILAAKQAEENVERMKRRQTEVERLSSQASLWRLAELLFTMLPVVFYLPLWVFDPASFWSYVAVRIDCCGPTFVKLAQWLSTRRDIFPDTVCEAFSGLQNQVSARWSEGLCSDEVAQALRSKEVTLKSLEEKAHASGSIAEVFFGVLDDGTDVAVKCLRPGVRSLLEADLAWLLRFSQLADKVETLRLLGVRQATEEFCEHVQMQTDFSMEADHLRRFRANFDNSLEAVRFPTPLFVTDEALVLSRETGQELANIFRANISTPASRPKLTAQEGTTELVSGVPEMPKSVAAMHARADALRQSLGMSEDLGKQVARQTMAAYMRMIFCDQFIHGDLHPGNIMLHLKAKSPSKVPSEAASSAEAPSGESSEGKPAGFFSQIRQHFPAVFEDRENEAAKHFELVILDAGLAIPLPRQKVEVLRSLAIAIMYADFHRAADILYQESPDSSRCWDPEAFKAGLAKAFESCRRNVWEEGFVQVSDACLESLHLVQYYNVGLDTTLTWTLFGMLSVEGSAKQLDPSVDCAQAATRYIITLPSLIREMRHQSPTTIRHMVCEMAFKSVGLDYWDWRYRNGLTWRDLQS